MSPDATAIELHVLNTGVTSAPEWLLARGGRRTHVTLPVLVALLRHPTQGWGLFDTGVAQRVSDATNRGVFRLYRAFVPMTLSARGAVVDQLARYSLTAKDISWVVLSHFHLDHVGGLADFPSARFIAMRNAFDDVRPRTGMNALIRGFVPSLVPAEFAARATLVPGFTSAELAPFGRTHDVFGDASALLLALPGHAAGQAGMLVRTKDGPVLLAADACWLSRSFRENRPPHWITNVIVDSASSVRSSISALHDFARANPGTPIIPSHCPDAHARWVGGDIA